MVLGHIRVNNRVSNVIYLLAIIIGYSFFFYISSYSFNKEITTCPFKNISGIPCPGCGMGRATLELIHFDLKKSLLFHPLAIPFNITILLSVIWLIKDLFTSRNSFQKFVKSKPKSWVLVLLGFILLAVWARNIIVGL